MARKGKRVPGGEGPRVNGNGKKKEEGGLSLPSPKDYLPFLREKKKRRRKQPSTARRFLRWFFSPIVLSWVFSTAATLLLLLLVAMLYFAMDLPDISGLGAAKKSPGIQILAADDSLVGAYGQIYGEYLTYKDLPPPLVKAVLATEDRRFFDHWGIDPWGILRAMKANIIAGAYVQGGSTITQQLAKNLFLTPDRTLKRKLQEMLLAFWLEAEFSKEEILSIYLNRVYLGSGNYGVDAAARQYFGKSGRELNLAESAVLAGLLKAPSRYAPTSDPERAKQRAWQVLVNMADAGDLQDEEIQPVLNSLVFPERIISGSALGSRYFADWIIEQLPQYVGQVEEDIVIKTTLEPKMQRDAEEAIKVVMTEQNMAEKNVHDAALVSMRPSGAIVAMVGGTDYKKSQFNRITQARRQPGSAFKMFVYLAAVEAGYTPEDIMEDAPITIPLYRDSWSPRNYDGKYRGPITLRQALAESVNTVAVQLSQAVGIEQVIVAARRLGVTSEMQAAPSLALGALEVTPLELTAAYAHLAASGKGVRPYGIAEIRGKKDDNLLYRAESPVNYIVLRPRTVAMLNSMLSEVIASGTGRGAAIGRPAAGKTGTASDYKDAWFMGYTPALATGVWVGNDDATPMKKITGGNEPARIWREYMSKALEGVVAEGLPTDYNAIVDEGGLPWQPGSGQWPSARPGDRRTPDAGEPPADFQLNKSFWDKLFDRNTGQQQSP